MLARVSWSLIAVLILVSGAWGEDPVAKETEPAKVEIGADLKELILKLDADSYADRTEASEALAKKGKDAVPALEEATRSDSLEASLRAFELLTKLYSEGKGETKEAAKAAFERLAKGEDSVAKQAKQVLTPAPSQPVQDEFSGVRILGGRGVIRIRPGIALAPIPVAGAIAVRKAVSVSEANGVKTIDVDDNGKKIKIVDDKEKGISGSITETKEGKEATSKFEAKNAEELKEKFPEAHKLYEQYAKGAGAAEIRLEAIAIGPGGLIEARPVPAKLPKEALEDRIKRLADQIEKAKAEKDVPEEVAKKRLEAYERLMHRYQESLKELEKEEGKSK